MFVGQIPLLYAAFLALGGLFLGGCDTRPKPNIVILLVDTLRADRLGCYGYARNTSPVLDSLATLGTLFKRCIAPADYTSASTASLFTGLYPLAHGYVHADYVLEESNLTLAEILAAQGYKTAAFVANGLAGDQYQMDQGFEVFYKKNHASAAEMIGRASTFIEQNQGDPFLLYMHFMEVHDPYRIPVEQQGRFVDSGRANYDMRDSKVLEKAISNAWWSVRQNWWDNPATRAHTEDYFAAYAQLYDASIFYWDQHLQDLLHLLAERDLTQNTIVVVTSDHGEQFLEHGFFGHANSGYEAGLHVPLVVRDPFSPDLAGRTIAQPVSIIDILPTLLTRLGIEVPADVQGRERWTLMMQDDETAKPLSEGIYSEGTFNKNGPFSSLIQTYREGPWKLVLDRHRDTKELYNLVQDAGEKQNRLQDQPEVATKLYSQIGLHYNNNLARFNARERSAHEGQNEKMKELLALGYLGGGGDRAEAEFLPMAPVTLAEFGPFGDEEDLASFGDRIDFARGPAISAQIIRGHRDKVGRLDTTGVWFDRQATFLLRNSTGKTRLVSEVYIDPDLGRRNPDSIQIFFDGQAGPLYQLEGPGRHRLESPLPPQLRTREYFHAELRANRRFLLLEGKSPKTDTYAALKVRWVGLEE